MARFSPGLLLAAVGQLVLSALLFAASVPVSGLLFLLAGIGLLASASGPAEAPWLAAGGYALAGAAYAASLLAADRPAVLAVAGFVLAGLSLFGAAAALLRKRGPRTLLAASDAGAALGVGLLALAVAGAVPAAFLLGPSMTCAGLVWAGLAAMR